MQLVVMGVSGSGKSTVAALIARRTGCELAEGDDFHSPSSVATMAAGHPLDDALRAPWLAAIASWLAERAAREECAVVSCSALRRAYRDVLRGAGPDVRMVHLAGPYDVVAQRLATRRGHFMSPLCWPPNTPRWNPSPPTNPASPSTSPTPPPTSSSRPSAFFAGPRSELSGECRANVISR